MNKNELIATLAAATMIHDDADLSEYRAADEYDQLALIRDYRDEFASSPFDTLADAPITDELIMMIHNILLTIDLN